jgi:hypothetical protein
VYASSLARVFRMKRSGLWFVVAVLVLIVAVVAGWRLYYVKPSERPIGPPAKVPLPPVSTPDAARVRELLFAELQPVQLKNCVVRRYGEPHDGGYLLCGNLLKGVQSGYSYGISGYDGWGCEISRTLRVPVHPTALICRRRSVKGAGPRSTGSASRGNDQRTVRGDCSRRRNTSSRKTETTRAIS